MMRIFYSSVFLLVAVLWCSPGLGVEPGQNAEPKSPPGRGGEATEPVEQPTAATLLERGFADFRTGRLVQAREDFGAAIGTGELNDAGRVLAYWHIHLAESELGHEDLSAEAASSFIVVAEDLLRDPSTARSDFVEQFDLHRRLAQARALMSATWARRVPEFGTSAARPIRVHSPAEVTYFLHFASTCSTRQAATDRPLLVTAQLEGLEHVTVRCDGEQASREFFFTYH